MKEAAGEANMTVITIILIGIVAAVAVPLITGMMNESRDRSDCISTGGTWNKQTKTCGPANANANG